MSQRTVPLAATEPSAVPPEADTGSAVIIAVAAPAQAAKSRRRKAPTTEAGTTEPQQTSSTPPLSRDDIAAACRALLLDYLVDIAGLPAPEAETVAARAVAALVLPPLPVAADTKLARLIALLRRRQGATLAELVAATGWQAHSVRGALSGTLKKKLGLAVTSEAAEGGRLYRLPAEG